MLSTCGTSLRMNKRQYSQLIPLTTCQLIKQENKTFATKNSKHTPCLSYVKPLVKKQEQITYTPITTEYYIDRMMEIQGKSQKKLDKEGHGAFIYKKDRKFFKKAITSPEQKIIGAFIKEGGKDVLIGYIVLDNADIKSHIDPKLLPSHIRANIDKINYSGTMITDPDYANRIKGIGKTLVGQANEHSIRSGKVFTISLISAENFPSIISSIKNKAYLVRAFIDPEDNTETYLMTRDLQQKISSDKIKVLKISKKIDRQKAMLLYNKIREINEKNPDIFCTLSFEETDRERGNIRSRFDCIDTDGVSDVLYIPRNI